MPKADLLFEPHRNSFSVQVRNLESLSVDEIKQLQEFVSKRKGIFDFGSYTFTIQKRLSFQEFEKIIALSSIDARCSFKEVHQKTQPRVAFGQYKGMLYKDLDDAYLRWLYGNYKGYQRDEVEKEIKRRGLV